MRRHRDKMKIKFIYLCLLSDDIDYKLDKLMQERTWCKLLPKESVYWVIGDPNSEFTLLNGNILRVPCECSNMIKKTQLAIDLGV